MISKNRYYRRSRISGKKFRQVIRYFSLDLCCGQAQPDTQLSTLLKFNGRPIAQCRMQAAGIAILVFPGLLKYIVAGYLIVLGLMGRGF